MAVGQQELQPLRQIDHRRGHAACRRLLIGIALPQRHKRTLLIAMQHGAIVARQKIVVAIAGRRHAQRREQQVLRQAFPRTARRLRDRLGADRRTEVRVVIRRAKGVQRLQPQPRDDLIARVAQVFQVVARGAWQARAVREEIADGAVRGNVRVAERKVRQIPRNGVIPRHRALGHLDGRHGCRQRLRDRRNLEHRARIHGRVLACLARAVALSQHRLAINDDRHRHAWHLAARHDVLDDARQRLHRLVLAARRNRDRVGGRVGMAFNGDRLRPRRHRTAQGQNDKAGDDGVFVRHGALSETRLIRDAEYALVDADGLIALMRNAGLNDEADWRHIRDRAG
ncbi:hypothetical protein D3C71_1206700 [compost metagenome]